MDLGGSSVDGGALRVAQVPLNRAQVRGAKSLRNP
jgi:hypothetical protein